MSWRSEARSALRQYPRCKRKQSETGEMQITPAYGGIPGGGTATRTTENVALAVRLTPHEENVISAVEFMMQMQNAYPNAQERFKMLELVHFKHTHTIDGAAEIVHYSPEALWRWNTEMLTAVYVALKRR